MLCSKHGRSSPFSVTSRKCDNRRYSELRNEGPFRTWPRVAGECVSSLPGHELGTRGIEVATQVALPVVYEGQKLEVGYRIDLVVENRVVVEVKSVEAVHPIHEAQLLSYMRLSGIPVGLLINFNVLRLRDGLKRMVDGEDWKS